ncbi:MAG: SulP family inorganic anion transporter [Caulobacteraceae bacterium]|nr:SulP family inorganic anion transporter [Caulobacteraceae bacterium]
MMAKELQSKSNAWPIFRPLSGLSAASLGHDVLAGLTLAAIAVPEQMATARLGGFAPEFGFFAFVAAAVGFAVFGASRRLSAGADSTITPIFAGSLALMTAAGSPEYAELAAVLALMVGLLLALAGLFKLGWIADLLSTPVVTGFLAGIAVHIALSQAPAVLGLPEGSGDVYHRLAAIARQAGGINPGALAIGAGVFAVVLGAEKLNPRIPGALIALAGATVATIAFNLDRRGVAVLGATPGGLPHLALPRLALENAIPLVGLAFVIALVVMVQTAATTRAFSDGEEPDVDRDYVGLGLANALAGLFGSFPVNASPPRTAIVAQAGGRSQYASLLAALAVLLLAAFGTGLLSRVPTAALAGVLLFVAQRIFHARTFADILRRTRGEFALALMTTVLIFALPIQTGVAIGIFLSLAHGVFTITRVRPIPFERVPETTVWWPASSGGRGEQEPGVLVMGFQAPLSFLNANDFRKGMLAAIEGARGAARLVVLEASSVVEIDFTASGVLNAVVTAARDAGMDFAVARLESVRAQAAFDRFGLTDRLGRDHLFRSVEEAIRVLARPKAANDLSL